jgi:sigma-B regulation protein RsbU (phosphoserine phosphatase)
LNRRTKRLSVVSAGHPPLILVNSSGKAQTIEMDGDPLGLFSSLVLQRKDVRVSPGDRFFLYSDGLIEAQPGGGRRQGMERLTAACVRHLRQPLAEATASIARGLRPDIGAVTDDLLLLAVEMPL